MLKNTRLPFFLPYFPTREWYNFVLPHGILHYLFLFLNKRATPGKGLTSKPDKPLGILPLMLNSIATKLGLYKLGTPPNCKRFLRLPPPPKLGKPGNETKPGGGTKLG
jgi:hypothetical protein